MLRRRVSTLMSVLVCRSVMQQQKEMQHGVGQIREELLTVPTFQSNIPMWDFSDIICSMLHRYAETVTLLTPGLGPRSV